MLKKSNVAEVVSGAVEGARSATGSAPGAAAEVKRWSANRKKEVVLRLLRGEPVDAISREVSVPIYRLEEWRDRALAGMDAGLKERENDPLEAKLGEATRRIGELVMESRSCAIKGRPDTLWATGGRRNEPRDLRWHRQALWAGASLPGAWIPAFDDLCQ